MSSTTPREYRDAFVARVRQARAIMPDKGCKCRPRPDQACPFVLGSHSPAGDRNGCFRTIVDSTHPAKILGNDHLPGSSASLPDLRNLAIWLCSLTQTKRKQTQLALSLK